MAAELSGKMRSNRSNSTSNINLVKVNIIDFGQCNFSNEDNWSLSQYLVINFVKLTHSQKIFLV